MANQDDQRDDDDELDNDETSSDDEGEGTDEGSDEGGTDDGGSDDAGSDESDSEDDEPGEGEGASAAEASAASAETSAAPAPVGGASAKAKKAAATAGARIAAAKAAKAALKAAKKAERVEASAAANRTAAPAPTEEEDPVEQIKESAVGQAAMRAQDWVGANQGAVLGVLGLAVLAFVGWLAYGYVTDSAAVAAADLLGEAVRISRAEIRDEGEEADADAEAPTFASVEERSEAALTAYRRVITEHGDSEAAGWARLGVARLLLTSGETEEARTAFEATVASSGADPVVAMRAYEGVGFTYEAEENWDEAREAFERIRGLENGAYGPVADYHLARVRLATGDNVGAQTALEELIDGIRGDSDSSEPEFPYVLAQAQTLLRELDPSSASGAEAPTLGAGASEEEIMEMIRRAMENRGEGGAAPPGAPPGGE